MTSFLWGSLTSTASVAITLHEWETLLRLQQNEADSQWKGFCVRVLNTSFHRFPVAWKSHREGEWKDSCMRTCGNSSDRQNHTASLCHIPLSTFCFISPIICISIWTGIVQNCTMPLVLHQSRIFLASLSCFWHQYQKEKAAWNLWHFFFNPPCKSLRRVSLVRKC